MNKEQKLLSKKPSLCSSGFLDAQKNTNSKQIFLTLGKQFDKCITELNKLIKMKGFSEFDNRTTNGLIKLEDRLSEEIVLLQQYKPYLKII